MAESRSHLNVTESNGVNVVGFADRKILEELSIREIEEEIGQLIENRPGANLLLSFRNVDHLSSAALGMLITLNKKMSDQGGKLKLSDISPQIFEVFKITRLNKLFDIHPTAEQALQSY
jgi:anti-sigma B factor antagonist